MKYLNDTSHYLKEGFVVPGFAEYAKQRLEKLMQPIPAPCYAVDGEQECLNQLHADIQKDPYQWFENRSNLVAGQLETRNGKLLTRLSDPLLYGCVQDACAALKVQNPSAFTFACGKELRYDISAIGHMDMMWILISEHLRENGILSDLELCFLIGRALGHAIACHEEVSKTCQLTPEQCREQALTADRAGLLAALWRTVRMYPALSADELVRKAYDVSKQAMHKMELLGTWKKKDPVTNDSLQRMIKASPVREKVAGKKDDLPTTWQRMDQLQRFAVSVSFVRCVSALWGETHVIAQSYSGTGMKGGC